MSIILSRFSAPSISSCLPAIILALFNFFASDLYKISFTRLLLPEPETQVTTVIIPSGNFTSMFLRLFSLAPFTSRKPVGSLRTLGIGT